MKDAKTQGTRKAREETGRPGAGKGRREDVRESGSYPASEPLPPGRAKVKTIAPLAAQAPRVIPRGEWQEFLDDFSTQRDDWLTTIDIIQPDQTRRVEARDLPLEGISFDVGEQVTSLSLGKDPAAHVTHSIPLTTKLTLKTDAELKIEAADGTKTLVRCRRPEKARIDQT